MLADEVNPPANPNKSIGILWADPCVRPTCVHLYETWVDTWVDPYFVKLFGFS